MLRLYAFSHAHRDLALSTDRSLVISSDVRSAHRVALVRLNDERDSCTTRIRPMLMVNPESPGGY